MVHHVAGFSGTPENYATYHEKINFNEAMSFGTKDFLKELLKSEQKNTQIQSLSDKSAIQELIEKILSDSNTHAYIDMGAHLSGINNEDVALEFLKAFEKNPCNTIKCILFFKLDQKGEAKLMALRAGEANPLIELTSTDPHYLEEQLGCTPQECFTYYDQEHAIGIDIPQSAQAAAIVTIDVDTTLSQLLQAVSRMRQLADKQSIKFLLSPALDTLLKMKSNPIKIEDLYECLEEIEAKKIAEDAFKATCKKLHDVVVNDLDERLQQLHGEKRIQFFASAEDFFVEKNTDDVLTLFKNKVEVKETALIFEEMKKELYDQWEAILKKNHINPTQDKKDKRIKEKFDDLIEKSLFFCDKTQNYNAKDNNLNTQIKIEQKVNTETKTQTKTQTKTETNVQLSATDYSPRHLDLSWQKKGLEGLTNTQGPYLCTLQRLWEVSSLKQYTVDWHPELFLSRNFYLTHRTQAEYGKEFAKPALSILFKRQKNGRLSAVLVSQEEAQILSNLIVNQPQDAQDLYWLETQGGVEMVGKKPKPLLMDYHCLREQILFLEGNIQALLNLDHFSWLSVEHLPLLDVLLKQKHSSEETLLLEALHAKLKRAETHDDSLPTNTRTMGAAMNVSTLQGLIHTSLPTIDEPGNTCADSIDGFRSDLVEICNRILSDHKTDKKIKQEFAFILDSIAYNKASLNCDLFKGDITKRLLASLPANGSCFKKLTHFFRPNSIAETVLQDIKIGRYQFLNHYITYSKIKLKSSPN